MVSYGTKKYPATDSISATQIQTGAVASAEILNGAIINEDINASAAIAKSKLAALAIANSDVASNAAIVESKLSLNYPTGCGVAASTAASALAQSTLTDGLIHLNTADSKISIFDVTTSTWHQVDCDSIYTYS